MEGRTARAKVERQGFYLKDQGDENVLTSFFRIQDAEDFKKGEVRVAMIDGEIDVSFRGKNCKKRRREDPVYYDFTEGAEFS